MKSEILKNYSCSDIKIGKVYSNKKNRYYYCVLAFINNEPIILTWLSNYNIKKLGIEN